MSCHPSHINHMNENNYLKDKIHYLLKLKNSNDIKASLIKGGFWTLIINGVNKVLMLIIGILMIRILGRTQYGIYAYFLSFISILIIPVEYGISNLIVRETAQAETRNSIGTINGLWRWSFRVTFFVSCCFIVLILLFVVIWGKSWLNEYQLFTLIWGLPLLLFQSLIHLSSAALRGMKKIILGQLPDIIIIPFLFIVSIMLSSVIWPDDLTSVFAMALRMISTLIALVVSYVILFKYAPREVFKTEPIFEAKKWSLSVIPFGLSTGLNMIKNHASILIMGFFVVSAQIASYQVAVSTAALAALVLHSMNTLLAPQFASFFIENEKRKLQKLVTISSRVVLGFNLIISIMFFIFGKEIIAFVFGPDTVDAYPALLVLLIGQLVNSFMGSVAFLLNMTGHERDVMKIVGISTGLNILLTFLLAPRFGIVGAALANSFSLIFAQIVMFFSVRNRLGIISNALGKIE